MEGDDAVGVHAQDELAMVVEVHELLTVFGRQVRVEVQQLVPELPDFPECLPLLRRHCPRQSHQENQARSDLIGASEKTDGSCNGQQGEGEEGEGEECHREVAYGETQLSGVPLDPGLGLAPVEHRGVGLVVNLAHLSPTHRRTKCRSA